MGWEDAADLGYAPRYIGIFLAWSVSRFGGLSTLPPQAANANRWAALTMKMMVAMRNITIALAVIPFLIGLTSCKQVITPTRAPDATPTLTSDWLIYINRHYGFSISHPAEFEVPDEDYAEYYGQLGQQIYFSIRDVNPLDCRGDCPVKEKTTSVQIAGQTATKIEGYLGAVGGTVPQQFLMYVFKRDNLYYIFMLYAVKGPIPDGDLSIQPLQADDALLFEQIIATFQFINE